MLTEEERIQRIIEHHEKEAEEESKRRIGDDPLYDGIAWTNIEPFLPKQGRILDAGGGAGVWSIRLAERSQCDIVLFDIAPRLLTTALRRIKTLNLNGRVDVVRTDIRAIPHPACSFDFVLCEGDPITICGDPEKAVSELSRVLKPTGFLAAGLDSTFYRAFKALSRGTSLDEVIEFLRTGRSPAEEGALYESKSFTPTEFASLARKHDLELIKLAGRPIGSGPEMLDVFVSAIPSDRRREIFRTNENSKLVDFLRQVYEEPYLAAIGSHLFVVMRKVDTRRD